MEAAKAKWAPFAEKYDIHEETYLLQAKLDEMKDEPYYVTGLEKARVQAVLIGK